MIKVKIVRYVFFDLKNRDKGIVNYKDNENFNYIFKIDSKIKKYIS